MKNVKAFIYLVVAMFTANVFSLSHQPQRRATLQEKENALQVFIASAGYVQRKFDRGRTGLKSRQRMVEKMCRKNPSVSLSRRSLARLLMYGKKRYLRGDSLLKR